MPSTVLASNTWQYECPIGPEDALSISVVEPVTTTDGEVVTTLAGNVLFTIGWPNELAWKRDADVLSTTP
jgi:hypothetical protein